MKMKPLSNQEKALWALRIGVAGEFVGHGVLAMQGKAQWVGWIVKLTGMDPAIAITILLAIGIVDVFVGLAILVKPISPILLWAIFWGFFTALIRPIVGESILDFIERWANWGAPLAIYFLIKPKSK